MSVNDVSGTQSIYDQINAQNQSSATSTTTSSSEDSEMFMKLMIAQLQNQDPTSPAETSEFMQQIASMSTVENIAKLNTTMETMSNSLLSSQAALQASSMIGQDIYAQTDIAKVAESGEIRGVVELPVSTENLRVSIYDSDNNLIDEVEMGSQSAGDQYFVWSAGDRPAGDYRVVAQAQVDGNYETASSYIAYNVNSVTLGQNGIGMTVNTDAGSVDFSDVKRIG
ncbi:flagellar hook capping FlgD N-terminal domain-containing protein [Amphritea sp. 1_MG-2023]|uniref:flagellar hook capping FlgD N-terminal domain-containing protein n=1 Tax=Amphritea sp. 1_MG-2023 TaxID=3062670 RepID=UPI0026E1F552|nr:flagellar hook capping FlgD N-terminal domain-containing protein [Amphritea sp. 1_MG-2023]MDO6564523.1 flagellar hook capping FlgD N-terminal domain-containing protein [Amphritea sp. 1_MG-2023]